ncbi:MAG: S8 family serine peptidase [Candidatus Thermoplasmatota archaeon]|nr:S8 family serine peptidase [Candidatus Thermoplasmatota archaeon]
MRNKIVVFAITFLLLISGLLVAAQGQEVSFEENFDSDTDDELMLIKEEKKRTDFENEPEEKEEAEYCQNSVLVQLEASSNDPSRKMISETILQNRVDTLLDIVGGSTSRLYPSFNMAEITFQKDVDVMNIIDILSSREEVVHAEPNYLVEGTDIPNDTGYDSLWALPKIDAPGAWNITTGSSEVVVPVIDTGIDYNHPDLEDNMWTSEEGYHGYNALNDSYYPMDDNGHGTHVAGTIGAVGDNDLGTVGVNWNVSLMGVKILDSEGSGNIGDVISGLEFVLERKKEGENILVTSNSWWGWQYSELLYEAIEQHQKEGLLFVTAAGNEGEDNGKETSYPGNYDLTNIISVAATDQNDYLAEFSNYGKRSVHVGAPGVNITSTILDGKYANFSGTSMSVPHVSGLAALLASHNSSYDYNNLKNVILSSADTIGHLEDRNLVDGRINASASLEQSPDPDDVNFWIHQPYSTTQFGEKTRIEISLNDGVNPIHGAEVKVKFSTEKDTLNLVDDGSGMDQVKGDGYYAGEWRPLNRDKVELEITVELEEPDKKMTKTVTVSIKAVHPESAQRVVLRIFDFIRKLLSYLNDVGKNVGEQVRFSFKATYYGKS